MINILLTMLNTLIFGYFLGSITHSETINLFQCIGILSTGTGVAFFIVNLSAVYREAKMKGEL